MRRLILLSSTSLLCAEDNNSIMLNTVGQLGGILESQATILQASVESMLILFGSTLTVVLTLISFFAYSRGQNLITRIEKNKDRIYTMTENIKEEVRYMDKETKSSVKEVKNEVMLSLKDVKDDIKQEVSQQIVHVAKEKILEVEEYAYRKIENSIMQINEKVQAKLFDYQTFIYKVNEAKKIEYDEIIDNEEISIESKLEKMISIQSRYNEINNQSVPKLFSEDIKEELISTAKKLSEYESIKEIVVEYLEKCILNENLSFADKARIRDVLHSYYHWEEPIAKESSTEEE